MSFEPFIFNKYEVAIICRIYPAGYRTRHGFVQKMVRLEPIYEQTEQKETPSIHEKAKSQQETKARNDISRPL
jgi:hypothetical protein